MNKHSITIALLLCCCSLLAQTITQAEYWIDSEPGFGKGTTIAITDNTAEATIPTESLSNGWHVFGVRAYSGSYWSQTYMRMFYIPSLEETSTDLTAAEWWLDTDPGYGNATCLPYTVNQTAFSFSLTETDTLDYGIHRVGMRVRQGNRWSETCTRWFTTINPADTVTALTAVEYWLDSDPGYGNATPVPFTERQTQFMLNLQQMDTLSAGYHTIGMRAKRGTHWSETYTRGFMNVQLPKYMTLGEVEAYWDGNDTQVAVIPYTMKEGYGVAESYILPTDTLSYGVHTLYLRAHAEGKMSVVLTYTICKNAIPAFSVLDEDAICVGDEVIILDESSEVQPQTAYTWDVDGDGKTDYTDKGDLVHTYTKAGRYTITLTVQTGEGCETTFSHEVYVHTKSTPSVSLSRSKSSICAGDSVVFTAKPTNGGENPQYMWLRNGEEIEGVNAPGIVLYDLKNNETVQVQMTTDNPCATEKTALSSTLKQTVYALPVIEFSLDDTYYTDDKAFTLSGKATPTGGTFYINDEETKLFNPKANPIGDYTVLYVVKNSNGCTDEKEFTFSLCDHTATDIDVIEDVSSEEPLKVLDNGMLYILMPDGTRYDATGAKVE